MDRTEKKVIESFEKSGGEKVTLVGHSAGGWLARAILGEGLWNGKNDRPVSELIRGLITLGSPHFPPSEIEADITRGCLRYVDDNFPGAFLSNSGLFYTSVGSGAVEANKDAERGSLERFAYQSYTTVMGYSVSKREVGDGVVPLSRSHLPGAQQLTLSGVFHSIDAPQLKWYGGPQVVDDWLHKA
jgi:pimeloyl-ACP methyl ester carboxylesterase